MSFSNLSKIIRPVSQIAAAKSLQSCPTLCDPIDGSPPGFPVPGIFQARTLEWVAISFSNAWKLKVKVKSLSRVRLFPTPWTAAYQAPPSMGFPRQEYWSGVPLPSPLWRPTRPFRTNTPKRCPFQYKGLECKSRKSRNTWVTGKFGLGIRNEAGQRLIEVCQENALVIANTLFQQHRRRLYTWTSPDGQHKNQIDYILCSQRWRSSIQSTKTRPGADWFAQIMNSLLTNSDWNWRR